MSHTNENIFAVWAKWRSIPCWLRHLHTLGYSQEALDTLEFIDDQFYLFADMEERLCRELQRTNLPRMEHEWLKVFPEAKDVIPLKAKAWRMKERALLAVIKCKLAELERTNPSALETFITREWIKLNEGNEVLAARKHIWRLRSALTPNANRGGRITQDNIEAAKGVPIQSLLPNSRFVNSGNNLKTICPLHSERTASFSVRTDRNTFHCFGCNRSGSSIDLVMMLYNCGFIEAVKRLAGSSGP